LVAARERLPRLAALFLGDIIMEESEISWIEQTDVSPLFEAYPALEHFTVRGGNRLSLGSLRHGRLKSLVIESGGLDVGVVRQVLAAELPALEHLELWLGSEHYGATTTVEDLAPLFAGHLLPKLRYLGLRDSEFTDAIAGAIAPAPILERIRVLDLSLGTLGDEGAAALLASPAVARLELLDIHHHFCSKGMVARLEKAGIRLNAGDRQKEEVYGGERWRYMAVSE
ncbi:MAG: STM4015 family protein, partial [Chloroflexi bacterium]|nr:STM4015 family protein [Chloroflexota bacterium]